MNWLYCIKRQMILKIKRLHLLHIAIIYDSHNEMALTWMTILLIFLCSLPRKSNSVPTEALRNQELSSREIMRFLNI